MKRVEKVKVELGRRSYEILVGRQLLVQIGESLATLGKGRRALVVTNPLVWDLYGSEVEKGLREAGFSWRVAILPDGEEYKTLETVQTLYDQALAAGLDRQSWIVAVGGGVVGDMAGFAAATFMRGINFVQVPTTLLAQVDSSVGGKTGVNHPKGKNLIGAFYQPRLVVSDIDSLNSLPEREWAAGLAEVVKYGMIWNEFFFEFLEQNKEGIWQRQAQPVQEMVKASCSIKAQVVSQDEQEQGLRAILNFGHTFGHGLEALGQYREWKHGEAVAVGMVMASRLAVRAGWLKEAALERLERLLTAFNLPVRAPGVDPEALWQAMLYDKKGEEGRLTFILPDRIGGVKIVKELDRQLILAAIAEVV